MFVLSSLYCRWQTPLFWGLPKHTFTTNNHGRVGTPAFQPALCGAPLIAKKKKKKISLLSKYRGNSRNAERRIVAIPHDGRGDLGGRPKPARATRF